MRHPIRRWAAYYHTALTAEAFQALDLIVFDRRYHPDFSLLKGKTELLAYVSIGEVHGDTKERRTLEKESLILYKNERWGSYAVDLRAPLWQDMVLAQVADALTQGFDGVFLDTVDSPLHWASQQPTDTYKKIKASAISLIRAIRTRHPHIKLMLNRGFEIAGDVAGSLDYLLAESILSYKDVFTGQFQLIPPEAYGNAVAQLQTIIARAENIQVLTLDYWNTGDGAGIDRIYQTQRAAGFVPYVTSSDLTHYTAEPSLGQQA